MIAVVALAESAAIALPFAPPIGLSIPYRTVSIRPARMGGTIRITLDQRLRFDPGSQGLQATATADDTEVEAPPAIRPMLLALFAGSPGMRTRARLGADGQVAGIIDGAESWAAVRACQAAALATLDADPATSPDEKARAHVMLDKNFDVDVATRDARLTDALAALLVPPLPSLRPGEVRRFASSLTGAAGPVIATGTVALLGLDARTLRYRIETRSDPASGRAAAAALLATLSPTASPGQRTRLEADAAAAANLTYGEVMEVTVERATGLLIHSLLIRKTMGPDGAETVVEHNETTRLVDTVS